MDNSQGCQCISFSAECSKELVLKVGLFLFTMDSAHTYEVRTDLTSNKFLAVC